MRKKSIYDQNGFRTDEFSLRIVEYFTNHEDIQQLKQEWKEIILKIQQFKDNNERQLVLKVRLGIPDQLRKQIWPKLIIDPVKLFKEFQGRPEHKQINLDLNRTFPNNKKVKQLYKQMKNVLNALAYALPELGYCQGMNFIVAIILLKLNEEEAFNVMYHIFHWEKHQDLLKNLFDIHKKMYVLDNLIKKHYPQLHKTLQYWQLSPLIYASPWFITLYCNTLPCNFSLRIIELYLMEGQKILYRVALQILRLKKKKLKSLKNIQQVIEQLKDFDQIFSCDINKFFEQMFLIKLSRKEIEEYQKQYKEKGKFQ